MKCKLVQNKLIFYSNGDLSSSENKEIKTHLQNCENCYALYTELETTLILIENKKTIEPNPFLYSRIKQKLDNLESKKEQATFNPVYKKILQPVILSFLLVIGLYSGVRLGNTFSIKQQDILSVSQTTEFYLNDLQQEKLEVLLLND